MVDEAHDLPPWLVPLWVARHAASVGARDVTVYLHDYEQNVLVPLSAEALGSAVIGTCSIDGTPAGRAYTSCEQVEGSAEDRPTLWTPLLDGGDRVGVLALGFDELTHERR